jgi:hypothetical protein
MLGKEMAKSAPERPAASHWRLTGNKEDNVFGHETEDGVDVTFSGCAVPTCDEIANGLFVSAHGNSLIDANEWESLRSRGPKYSMSGKSEVPRAVAKIPIR